MPMPNNRWLIRILAAVERLNSGSAPAKAQIYGDSGSGLLYPIKVDAENGVAALAVNVQDQTTKAVFIPFHYHTGNTFTLTAPAQAGDWTIDVSPGHGLVVGDPVATGNNNNWYYGNVVGVALNTITLDQVINIDYPAGQQFEELVENLAVNGAVNRVESHIYSVPGIDIDLTGIHILINSGGQPDDSLFGDLAALTRGISLRKLNGLTGEYFNMGTARNNGAMALFTGGLVTYTDKGGAGTYTTLVDARFREQWGVALRLRGSTAGGYTPNGRDEIHMVIQDDLTGLNFMYILGIGHITQ